MVEASPSKIMWSSLAAQTADLFYDTGGPVSGDMIHEKRTKWLRYSVAMQCQMCRTKTFGEMLDNMSRCFG